MFVQGEATQKLAGRVDRQVIKLSRKCRPLIPQEFPKNLFMSGLIWELLAVFFDVILQ